MYLVFVEVESGDSAVVVDEKADVVIVSFGTYVVSESSSMAAHAWCGELDLGDDPEAVRDEASGDPEG